MYSRISLIRELKKYKSLQGYEKEDWLKAKRKESAQVLRQKNCSLN